MDRKRVKGRSGKHVDGPCECKLSSAADKLKAALAYFTGGAGRKRGKPRRHADDYKEYLLSSSNDTPLSQALFELTEETYQCRHRLLPDEVPSLALRKDRAAETPQGVADEATREIEDDMKHLGILGPTHYYSASERRETGEIDRTYDVARKPRKAEKPCKRS